MSVSLDDLASRHPVPVVVSRLQELFITDFGEIAGEFVEQGSSTEFHSMLDGQPIAIRIQRSPRGLPEYVINGNTWYPPANLRALELEQRQMHLINAVRRYR